jgi:hypothetical protein
MKTLEQIEPRKPISALPFTINTPGSYYLTTNLTGSGGNSGIIISADNVTLDLAGFALIGVANSLDGVRATGTRYNLRVHNGTVSAWRQDGVDALAAENSHFENLRISGSTGAGLKSGFGCSITQCKADGNGGTGIIADDESTLMECTATYNRQDGISVGEGCVVKNCLASGNSTNGIVTGDDCTIKDCTASRNAGTGVVAGAGCTLVGCSAGVNSGPGISTGGASTIQSCTARGNFEHGILPAYGSTVSDCIADDNGMIGIYGGDGDTIKGCTTSFNGGNGIDVNFGAQIKDCSSDANGGSGIRVAADCQVVGNTCRRHAQGAGIVAFGLVQRSGDNRIESNNVTDNNVGIQVAAAAEGADKGNLIIKNSAAGNTTNYNIPAGNKVGVIVAAPDSAAISGDTGGVGVGTTNPWANFSF